MSEELRPCPFCGEIPVTENNLVACANKSCPTYDNYWTDPQILTIEQWNTRPLEDVLQSRIAELEKDNDEFRQLIHDWIIILTPDDGYVPDSECNDVATPIDVALRKRIAELEGKIDQLTAHDATERQDDKWIPVSERLPDNWKPVLTIDMSESTRVPVPAFYDPETSLWSTHLPNYDLWVTHWMPLPEPPIVYGKVCEE